MKNLSNQAVTTATKAEKARMDAIEWCLPCLIDNKKRQAEIQHVTSGGRRLGHLYTYGLCPYHHRGLNDIGITGREMSKLVGPSFAHSRKTYEQFYGDERDVLVKLQTWVLNNDYEPYWRLHEKWQLLRQAN